MLSHFLGPGHIAAIALVGCMVPAAAQVPSRSPNPPKSQRVYPPPMPPETPESRLGPRPSRPVDPNAATLQIDLFMSETAQPLHSQAWGRVFQTLGHRVRIKTGGVNEQLQLTETKRGPLRTVLLVGQIDRRGTLIFPGKTFQTGDEKQLKDWLEELQAYGAQGNPSGQPRWGLSTEQFQGLFASLAQEVETDVKGQPLVDVVRSFGFGIDVPLRVDDSVAEKWKSAAAPMAALQDVRGLSRGSALAVLLNDHDLCARPLRTPSGSIDLVVLDKAVTPDPWPLGWEPRPDVQRSDYAPALFAFGPIGFLDRPITEILDDARLQTGCGMVIDLPGAAKKEVDLARRTFGLPQKNTAWILVLQSALTGTSLVPHIRIDEAGRGFVLVAPFESRTISNR